VNYKKFAACIKELESYGVVLIPDLRGKTTTYRLVTHQHLNAESQQSITTLLKEIRSSHDTNTSSSKTKKKPKKEKKSKTTNERTEESKPKTGNEVNEKSEMIEAQSSESKFVQIYKTKQK
jgi:hypothetical protein